MSTTVAAFKLVRPDGRSTRCLLSNVEGRCNVILWNASSIVLWERHESSDSARHRTDELWTMLVSQGYEPPRPGPTLDSAPLYRRKCPDCGLETATVRYRRGAFLVVDCSRCHRSWNDRARTGIGDRRAVARKQSDRREPPSPATRIERA